MKKFHLNLGRISTVSRFRLGVLLTVFLFLFSFAYPATVLTVSSPSAEAQGVVLGAETAEVTESADEAAGKTISATITNTSTPPPAPAPKPAPAAKPAPAYDKVNIPSIGLSARYVTVGLTSAGAIDVHPTLAGWWNGSSAPGTPSAAFIDGHNPGVFSKLPNISVGAQISISKANGEVFNYTVVNVETVDLVGINMRRALSTQGGLEGLNLMTCVGPYNPNTGTTDQRLVVYATRA